jgi:hypothetical protein
MLVHGWGSDGETGECFAKPQNITSRIQYKCYHLTRTPQLQVIDWPVELTDLHGLVQFTERWNLVFVCVCHLILTAVYIVSCGEFFFYFSSNLFLISQVIQGYIFCMIFIFQEHINSEKSTREVAATTLISKIIVLGYCGFILNRN